MKTAHKSLSTPSATPWYRQFWPWFIIALPACVVVSSLYMLILANQHADDLVVDDYYKQGLAINQILERDARATELGLSATLLLTGLDKHRLTARVIGDIHVSQLRLRLSHPMEAAEDLTLSLKRIDEHDYSGTLNATLAGQWHWILDDGEHGKWRVTGEQRF